MRKVLAAIVLVGAVVALLFMVIIVKTQQEDIRQLEAKIYRDSIMREMLDSVESAGTRWRNRCYEVAIERSINPEEVCDAGS